MELTAIERYFVDKFGKLEQENVDLKEQLRVKQNSESMSIRNDLGEKYYINTYDWSIRENNITDYEKALKNEDFSWLQSRDYSIHCCCWNLEADINGFKFKLLYGHSGGESTLSVVDIENDGYYDTREEARKALLDKLSKDIDKKRKEFNIKSDN